MLLLWLLLVAAAAVVPDLSKTVDGQWLKKTIDSVPWSLVPQHSSFCVNASTPAHPANRRSVFVALPKGTAPAAGWPVYLSLATDGYTGTCGNEYHLLPMQVKNYSAFDTPCASMRSCFDAPGGAAPANCIYDQEAGQLWDSRMTQLLVAHGFSVVLVNPNEDGDW